MFCYLAKLDLKTFKKLFYKSYSNKTSNQLLMVYSPLWSLSDWFILYGIN